MRYRLCFLKLDFKVVHPLILSGNESLHMKQAISKFQFANVSLSIQNVPQVFNLVMFGQTSQPLYQPVYSDIFFFYQKMVCHT